MSSCLGLVTTQYLYTIARDGSSLGSLEKTRAFLYKSLGAWLQKTLIPLELFSTYRCPCKIVGYGTSCPWPPERSSGTAYSEGPIVSFRNQMNVSETI